MASEDAVYRESSQFRLWSFSPAQLSTLRAQTNELARASIEDRRRQRRADEGDRDAAAAGAAAEPAIAYLTPAEERLLLDFYTVELLRAGQFMGQPTEVQATAAVFLRRFYVTHSIMTYPPAALFKTALFFGAKSEGYYHTLDGFAEKFPNTTAADILAGEFLLCQGIRFAFDVKHPFRGLEGAIMELRRLADGDAEAAAAAAAAATDAAADSSLSDNRLAAAHRAARDILKFSPLVTDAYFHYTPSQIMLAALWLADRGLVERLLLGSVFRREAAPEAAVAAAAASGSKKKRAEAAAAWERACGAMVRDRTVAAIEACAALLATEPPARFTAYWGQPESNNLIKPLLRKLKACRDPDRSNLVALQAAKKAGAVKAYATGGAAAADGAVFGGNLKDAAAADDKSLHEAKRRRTAKLDDPFGPPLR